jgi:hypothetical protein
VRNDVECSVLLPHRLLLTDDQAIVLKCILLIVYDRNMCSRSVTALRLVFISLVLTFVFLALFQARAQILAPDFTGAYSMRDLGAPAGVPTSLGGMTFKAGDPDTFLIGGQADGSSARIYLIRVARDAGGHITGFVGTAFDFAEASGLDAGGIDGGSDYGPGGVLFIPVVASNVQVLV